ncbi:MAG TPA: ATP-binding cassette domain-containing protein [Planctomycetota bacterium]|nr:ATP-binding cassette domain-containing protein [Planctomycetota bacterium]
MSADSVLVETQNLVKTYGPLRAVDDLSFQIKAGEIVGLLGPNGAGKSTTMKLLTCYLAPTSGSAKVAGIDVTGDAVEVRKHIGYLPEHAPLYTDMRVNEYLDFAGRVRGLNSFKRRERIDWAVKACGLEAKFKATIGTLSRGYRQRCGLAQAVLHDPDLLILDEPTSGLDPIQLIEIRKLIQEVGQKKTVLFSTHIMQEVEAVCNRAMIVNRGKLVADGPPAELKARLGTNQKIVARIRGPEAAAAEKQLYALRDVTGIDVQQIPNGNWLECTLKLNDGANVNPMNTGEQVAKICKDNAWDIQELKVDAVTLEDAFLKVTGHEKLK